MTASFIAYSGKSGMECRFIILQLRRPLNEYSSKESKHLYIYLYSYSVLVLILQLTKAGV